MLTKIEITNFKIFKEKICVPLSNLNIFTGANGRGKSTALQALILMKQSLDGTEIKDIKYHSKYLELGSFDDIKSTDAPINFSFYDYESYLSYSFHSKDNGKKLKSSILEKTTNNDSFVIDFNKIHYISAERLGPKVSYERHSEEDLNGVGKRGEFVASTLFEKQQQLVHKSLVINDDKGETLLAQTGDWLNQIFKGCDISIKSTIETIIEVGFKGKFTTKFSKPTNIGFGFSNVLPIIVAGLIANEGDILIIDSPEAHLHPSAQSELAKFLAKISLIGVQVFVETHSEHILNGVRIAIKSTDINILSHQLSILYFDDQIKKIEIQEDGSINDWPKGFFDQAIIDEEYLLWN